MSSSINEWPGREAAERSRQWPIFVEVCDRVALNSVIEGLIVIGSFVSGTPDDLSDVDLIAVAGSGCFEEAWEQRTWLRSDGALIAWDSHAAPSCQAHKWLTRDLAKVECLIVDPTAASMKLADPCAVIVGDASLVDRFPRIPRIPDDVLADYAQQIRDDGLVPEVETKYGELKTAIRRALAEDS